MAVKTNYSTLAALALLLCLVAARAVAAEIAVVKSSDIPAYNEAVKGFVDRSAARITTYNVDTGPNETQTIIADIKARRPDLIFVVGTQAATVISRNVKNAPVLFALVSRPERYGLTGDNITGISLNIPPKIQFRAMRDVLPKARKIGVMYNPEDSSQAIKQAHCDARAFGFELIAAPIHSEKDVPQSLRNLKDTIDVLWMVADRTIMSHQSLQHIIMFTIKNSIPLMAFSARCVEEGALCAMAGDCRDMGQQAAGLASQILAGKSPSELPIAAPEKTKLVLNLRTAELIGLRLSLRSLGRRTEVQVYE